MVLHQKQESMESGRVDPRIARTRQLLEDAFMELLHNERFEAITVRDITQRAGVNRATFYAHFEDKYALFTYSIKRGFNEVVQTRLPQNATLTKENLVQFILALSDFFILGNSRGCTNAQNQPLRPLIESRIHEQIADLIRTWLKNTEELSPRAKSEVTAILLSWSIFGLAHNLTTQSRDQAIYQEIGKAVDTMLYGVMDSCNSASQDNSYRKVAPRAN